MHIFFLLSEQVKPAVFLCFSARGPRKLQAPSEGQLVKEREQGEGKGRALVAHDPVQEIDDHHEQQEGNGHLRWHDRVLPEARDSKLKEGR